MWFENRVSLRDINIFDDEDNMLCTLQINNFQVQQANIYKGNSFYNTEGPLKPAVYKKGIIKNLLTSNFISHLGNKTISKTSCVALIECSAERLITTKTWIEDDSTVQYHWKQPYPVPMIDRLIFKGKLDRQVDLGILEHVYDTAWGIPMFATKKASGIIQTGDDFRELNKVIKRVHYPLPKIQDFVKRRHNYHFFTKIDISMKYYCFHLDKESSWY